MKYGVMIGWAVALCGATLSSATALVPDESLKGQCYDITYSREELQAETKRCEKLLKQKGDTAAAKSAKTKERKKDAEPEQAQWDAPRMARFALLGRAVLNYLSGQHGEEPAGTHSPTPLFISRLFVPLVNAKAVKTKLFMHTKAPSAGQESVGLVAVYRGRVVPPKGGSYRFVGAASDFMIVRVDGKVVLEAGEWLPRLMKKDDPRTASAAVGSKHYLSVMKGLKKGPYAGYAYNATFSEIPSWNKRQGGLTLGSAFTAAEGRALELEVIVASVKEEPEFGCVLYVEDTAAVKTGGSYPLFCTDEEDVSAQEVTESLKAVRRDCDTDGMELPPHDRKSAPWKVKPTK